MVSYYMQQTVRTTLGTTVVRFLGFSLVVLAVMLMTLPSAAHAALTVAATSVVSDGALTLNSTGSTALTIAPATAAGTVVIGKTDGTGAMTFGSSSAAQTVNIADGAGAATLDLATGAGGNTINVGTGNAINTIHIGDHATPVNVITIGGAASSVAITDAQWSITSAGAIATASSVLSSSASAGIGYATGAGCAVTQATSRTTGVTCNGVSGAITTDTTALPGAGEAAFTVTNSSVAIGDVIIVSLRSGSTAGTSLPFVSAVAAGSFDITLTNVATSTSDTGAGIINFAVIKAVSA